MGVTDRGDNNYNLIFFGILIVHVFDVFVWKFSGEMPEIMGRIIMYLVLGFFIAFKLSDGNKTQRIVQLFFVSLVPVLFYPLITKAVTSWINAPKEISVTVWALMVAFPALAMYCYSLGFNEKMTMGNWYMPVNLVKLWIIVWMFIFIFLGLSLLGQTFGEASFTDNTQISTTDAIERLGDIFTDTRDLFVTTVQNAFVGTKRTYDDLWNQTLGDRYAGEVEENRQEVGVSLRNFEAREKYYEKIPITFFPIIKARSFGDTPINVKFKCIAYDQQNKSNNVTGIVDPPELEIKKFDDQGIICTFNKNENGVNANLREGRYRVEFTAEFDFETWAYTTYVFMENQFLNSLRANDEDVNTKFNIPKKPAKTIYTSGPVMIGMNQEFDLPIGLSYTTKTNIPIGITLENRERSKGEITNVKNFQLLVPEQFELEDCTKPLKSPLRDFDTGYSIYRFENTQIDKLQSFLTVDCRMKIEPRYTQDLIIDAAGVSAATMVGTAEYTYKLKEWVIIRVEGQT